MFDFTDSAHPVEIAYFDRGPVDAKDLIIAGYWSAYWYNGLIYASEIARGLDAFRLKPSALLSQNEIDAAMLAQTNEFNAQAQSRLTWPATPVVARAYTDQLVRSHAISSERMRAVSDTLARSTKIRSSRDKGAAALLKDVDSLSEELERDAAKAAGIDGARLKSPGEVQRMALPAR